MSRRVSIPFLKEDDPVQDLLMWKDPRKSGAVFGACTAIFLFFQFTTMPLITILCYGAGLIFTVATLWARFGKTVGKPMPELPYMFTEGMSEEEFRARCDKLKPTVDKVLGMAGYILTCKDAALNLKIIGALFITGKVLHNVPFLVIMYMGAVHIIDTPLMRAVSTVAGVLVAFIAPKVYDMYKDEIDEHVAKGMEGAKSGMARAQEEASKAMSKVPALQNVADKLQNKKVE